MPGVHSYAVRVRTNAWNDALIRDYNRKHASAQMSLSTDQRAPAAARARFRPLVNTLIVAGGFLLSRLLGFGREIIIADQFGIGGEIDAYRAAFKIPDLIYLVVAGGALGSAFIPIFAGFLADDHEEDAWRLASGILNWAFVAMAAACVLIALLADPIVALTIGSGFDPAKRALTVQILRLLLVQPLLLGLGGLAKASLESFDRFTLPAIGANLYTLGVIAGALLLAPSMGIVGLVWGVIGGAALFLLVQLPGLLGIGARYTPVMRLDLPGLRQVLRLLAPRLLGQSVWQVNMIVIASFATALGDGAVSANEVALQLMLLPHGVIALSLGTVMFPQLARYYAAGDMAALRARALGAVRSVLFLALPVAALLGALALPLLRALFQRGRFDGAAAALTADALMLYALGLAAFAAAEIIVRTFYAMRDTRTPVYVSVAMVLLNIGLGWALLRLGWGLGGLALAFSVANIAEAAVLLRLLGARVGGLGAGFWRALGGMAAATLAFSVVLLALLRFSQPLLPFLNPGDTYRWPADFVPLALWLAAAVSLSAAIYVGIAWQLGSSELRAVVARLRPFRKDLSSTAADDILPPE